MDPKEYKSRLEALGMAISRLVEAGPPPNAELEEDLQLWADRLLDLASDGSITTETLLKEEGLLSE